MNDLNRFRNEGRHKRKSTAAWAQSTKPSEESERLAGDRELYEVLREQGSQGRDYDDFEIELMGYGFACIKKWILTRELLSKCQEKLRFVPAEEEVRLDLLTPDETEEIAQDIVVEAVLGFRKDALVGGKWSPTGGASLKTFFVGRCLIEACKAMEQRARELERTTRYIQEVEDAELLELPSRKMSLETQFELDDELRRVAGLLSAKELEVTRLHAVGLSAKEIADRLGMFPRNVNKTLERTRAKARKHRNKGGVA
ncbi:sigma-70 family RNA polymerase sigma factor [Corynebacterium propinquum]|uniref:sigma-70 family RNA polymerase sigma factor n=1 Tax=Corynebacterium propinquum TaxID=43769 RepID=UPI0021AEDB0C|nr:sigma-70 family RNA polymerase sigma factor [Corynebacterium propinquum]MCT1817626.1 sigma-70 family RNA polymerase sigma factor [Corynebacterium propinquum]